MKSNQRLALIAALIIANSSCSTSVGAMNQVPQNVAQIEQDQLRVNDDFNKKCEILKRLDALLENDLVTFIKPSIFSQDDAAKIRVLIKDYQGGNVNVIEEINQIVTKPYKSLAGPSGVSAIKRTDESTVSVLVDYANAFLDQTKAVEFIESIDKNKTENSLFFTTPQRARILLDGIQDASEKINFIMYKNEDGKTVFNHCQFHDRNNPYNQSEMLKFFIDYLIKKCKLSKNDICKLIKQKDTPHQQTMLHYMLGAHWFSWYVMHNDEPLKENLKKYKWAKFNKQILLNQFPNEVDQFKFLMTKDVYGKTAYKFYLINKCIEGKHKIKDHPFLIDTHKEFGTLMFSALALGSSEENSITYEKLNQFLKLAFGNDIGIKMFKKPEEVLGYVNELNNLNKLNLPEDMLNKAIEFERNIFISDEGINKIIELQSNKNPEQVKQNVLPGTFTMSLISKESISKSKESSAKTNKLKNATSNCRTRINRMKVILLSFNSIFNVIENDGVE